MDTLTQRIERPAPLSKGSINPSVLYFCVVTIVYGWMASFTLVEPLSIWAPNRDIWQHLAVVRALIENPISPRNPFVDSMESCRSFGPVWVAIGFIGNALNWTPAQALGAAAVFNLAILALGIFAFARTFLPTKWGPLALLAAMTLGWSAPLLHTGFHSPVTLIEGAAYPAVTMIGAALLAWAATRRLLCRPQIPVLGALGLALCLALMTANHQLGAAIAIVGIACIASLAPGVQIAGRCAVMAAICVGLVLSTLWPYHNPLAVLGDVSDPRWSATQNFYSPGVLGAILTPAAIGIWGLARVPSVRRPFLAALAVFGLAFAAGALPLVPTGHRFSMPAILVLHIGLAIVLLSVLRIPGAPHLPERARRILIPVLTLLVVVHVVTSTRLISRERQTLSRVGELPPALDALLPEPRADSGFAGYGVAAWPIVASGRRVLSVPWPEPLIHDLTERQAANAQLFARDTPLAERLKIADTWKIHSLVIDTQFAAPAAVRALLGQGIPYRCAGPFIRFDLRSSQSDGGRLPATESTCRLALSFVERPLRHF